MEKTCLICKETKGADQFSPNNQKKDGLHPYCKPCQSAKQNARRTARLAAGGVPRREGGEKRCPKCDTFKPVEAFGSNRANPDGLQVYCRICSVAQVTASRHKDPTSHRASSKAWREKNVDRHADNNAKRRYGIDHGTYAKMLEDQGGVCAICGTTEPGGNTKRFHIDHCHSTGKVRGLLCGRCNTGLGQLRHSPDLIRSAIDYLVKHSSTKGR